MPLFSETPKYIYFHNTTDLPLLICRWITGSNTLKTTRIGPNEKHLLHSSVGEWHINSMFDDGEDRDVWTNSGLGDHHIIGKFRSDPCAMGEYSWMEYSGPFKCIYSEIDGENKGLITLIKET